MLGVDGVIDATTTRGVFWRLRGSRFVDGTESHDLGRGRF